MKNEEGTDLSLGVARRAMKIVIFIGMVAVVLLMINIYIMLTQITATAQMSRELNAIKQVLQKDGILKDTALESKDNAQDPH